MVQKLPHIALLLVARNQTQAVCFILFGHNKQQILYFYASMAKNIIAPHADTVHSHGQLNYHQSSIWLQVRN